LCELRATGGSQVGGMIFRVRIWVEAQ